MKTRRTAALILSLTMLFLCANSTQAARNSREPAITMEFIDNMLDAVAYPLIGTPYELGAKGPGAFDCSTYISYIFKYMGVSSVSGTSRQLAANTKWPAVNDISQIMRGDLLFFGSPEEPHTVSHVALYLGEGLFIHCSVSGEGVAITDFYAFYYYEFFIGARRLIKEIPSGVEFGIPAEMMTYAEEAAVLMSMTGNDYRTVSVPTSDQGSSWAVVYEESAGGMTSYVIE